MRNLLSTYQCIWLHYTMIKTRLKHVGFERYCYTIAQCGHCQIWQCQRCLTSDSCFCRLCHMNVKQACKMRKWQGQTLSMSEDGNPVCTYSGANSCKKFGFVTTSIELNEHGFLSPLKPRRKVPADTVSQIWCLAVWTSVFVQELQQIKLQVCKELKFLRNLTQNPNQCGTSLHNGEIAMARHVNVWRWKSCLYIQRC